MIKRILLAIGCETIAGCIGGALATHLLGREHQINSGERVFLYEGRSGRSDEGIPKGLLKKWATRFSIENTKAPNLFDARALATRVLGHAPKLIK